MAQKNESWSLVTKTIFTGVLLYALAGILYAILSPIEAFSSAFSTISSLSGGGGFAGSSVLSILSYILLVGIIVGYFLFFKGLSDFGKILEPADATAIGKVRTGVLLALIAAVVALIPFLGWVSTIIGIIAYILMLLGYSALKSSQTFPAQARNGASKLFLSLILLVIGAVIGFIPVVGSFIEGALSIIAFILVLLGWSTIKKASPDTLA